MPPRPAAFSWARSMLPCDRHSQSSERRHWRGRGDPSPTSSSPLAQRTPTTRPNVRSTRFDSAASRFPSMSSWAARRMRCLIVWLDWSRTRPVGASIRTPPTLPSCSATPTWPSAQRESCRGNGVPLACRRSSRPKQRTRMPMRPHSKPPGQAVWVGSYQDGSAEVMSTALQALASDVDRLGDMSSAAAAMTNGAGAGWIAAALGLAGLGGRDGLMLRPSEHCGPADFAAIVERHGQKQGDMNLKLQADGAYALCLNLAEDGAGDLQAVSSLLGLIGSLVPDARVFLPQDSAAAWPSNQIEAAGFTPQPGGFVRAPGDSAEAVTTAWRVQ